MLLIFICSPIVPRSPQDRHFSGAFCLKQKRDQGKTNKQKPLQTETKPENSVNCKIMIQKVDNWDGT